MKHLLSALCVALCFIANAQIENNWLTTIPAANLPTNASRPTVDELASPSPSKRFFTLNLDATTYDNATGSTGWAALAAAVKTEIDSNYVVDSFGLDETLDIMMRTVITNVKRQWDAFEFLDLSEQYLADEDVFRVSGYCEWGIE